MLPGAQSRNLGNDFFSIFEYSYPHLSERSADGCWTCELRMRSHCYRKRFTIPLLPLFGIWALFGSSVQICSHAFALSRCRSRLCSAMASSVVWGNSLSVISGRVSQISTESTRKGAPSTIIGSGGHSVPRLDMNGTTMLQARANVELNPVAWVKIQLDL